MEKFSIFWTFRLAFILDIVEKQVIGNLAQFSRLLFN